MTHSSHALNTPSDEDLLHADRDIERLSDDRAKTALQTYHNTIEQSFFALCAERERMVQRELVKSG